MTDWGITNLVRGKTTDRSTPTGQTGLSRGRSKVIPRVKNITSRRRRMNLSQCKWILGRLQLLMLCKLRMAKAESKMYKRDR